MFSVPTLPRIFGGLNTKMDMEKHSLTLHVDEIDNSTSSTLSTISCASAGSIDSDAGDDSHINYYSTTSILNDSEKAIGYATANTVAASTRTGKKRVRFGSLEIYEHAVVLGGSGVPRNGPPTTLNWEAQANYTIKSVEVFEDSRPVLCRKGSELLRPKSKRIDMLLEAGHTLTEINRSSRENDIILTKRLMTIKKSKQLSSLSKVFRLRKIKS
jgi:hypothetical protein